MCLTKPCPYTKLVWCMTPRSSPKGAQARTKSCVPKARFPSFLSATNKYPCSRVRLPSQIQVFSRNIDLLLEILASRGGASAAVSIPTIHSIMGSTLVIVCAIFAWVFIRFSWFWTRLKAIVNSFQTNPISCSGIQFLWSNLPSTADDQLAAFLLYLCNTASN